MTRFTRRPPTCRRFTLRPLPLALAIAIASSTVGARAGDSFTNVQQVVGATISTPNANTTNVNQTANNAYIQTGGFNIAAQDAVKVFQPSSTSNLLIQVSGYDPSAILGQLQANGRVFLSNPNGVLFGAGARIDVGSLVATNLSMDADEFMRNRVRLVDRGNSRGSVVNAGSIKATGTVALVGTEVTNLGSIEASRIGMAALTDVVVDVEGDGLIFFQMSGNRASAKLQQLGSLTADGGLVELRAEARGTVADTVLNMDGIIQARSIGSRNGQVIIDGGSSGITKVTGTIDVQGTQAGETGGTVKVLGDLVALGSTALIDASGVAGGGTVLVGGNYQGSGDERRASHTRVAEGATIKANALTDGDGGTVVVWADGTTAFQGLIEARGGAQSGNGGTVEVSGKQQLAFWGVVDAFAAHGALGSLLLDPTNIYVVANSGAAVGTETADFTLLANAGGTSGDYSVLASSINASTADITLAASNNITVNATINRTPTSGASGKSLTLMAGNNITINNAITTKDGNLILNANGGAGTITLSADLDAGSAAIDLKGKVSLTTAVDIDATAGVHFYGTVDSATSTAQNLSVTSNSIELDGNWGDGHALGTVDLHGPVKLGNDVTITAGSRVKFFSTLDSLDATDARDLTVTADLFEVTGQLGGNFNLGNLTLTIKDLVLTYSATNVGTTIGTASGSIATISNRTANGAIFVKTGSGAATELYLNPSSDLAQFAGFQELRIGSTTGSGNVTQDGAWSLPTNVVLQSGTGTISLKSNIDATTAGAQSLTLTTSGTSGTVIIGDDGADELYGNTKALSSLTVTGKAIQIYASTIKTTGNQSYTGGIALQDNVANSLTLNGADISLGAITADTAARSLSVTASGNVTLNGAIGNTISGSQGIAALTIDSTGTTTFGTSASSVTTSGDQLYKGAVVVKAGTTAFTSTTEDITFEKTLDADGTAHNVTLTATTNTKAVTLGGAVGALSPLDTFTVNGVANINGGDSSTAAVTANVQDYKKNVVFGGAASSAKTLVANTLTFASGTTITATGHDLTLRTNALNLNGATSVGGNALTIVQRTASGNIGVGTSAVETLNLTASDLTALDSFSTLTIGEAANTTSVEFGVTLSLAQDTTLIGSTSVKLKDVASADAGTHKLALTSGSSIFTGNVTGVSELSTSGNTTVNGNITAATLINFGGTTTLATIDATTTSTLDATTVTLNNLDTGTRNIVIKADTLNVNGTVASTGANATITTHTANKAIALQTGTAASDLEIGATTLAKFSPFALLTIGGNGNNAISATTSIVLPTATVLTSGTGTIGLAAVDGGNHALTLTGSGDTTLSGAFTNVTSLTSNGGGKTVITTDLTTTTAMNFASSENVAFDGGATSITLQSGAISFSGNLDADGKNLTLATDALALTGTISNAGTSVTLTADTRSLIRVGTTGATPSLTIGTALLGKFSGFGTITVGSGNIDIVTGDLTLPKHMVFASGSGDITLGQITGGGFDLATTGTGTVTFGGTVAGVHDLTVDAGDIVINTASIETTNKQVYNADVGLGTGTAARLLSAPTIELAAGKTITTGTHDLTLKADTLTAGAGAGITGSTGSDLVLSTFTASKSIGVMGGTGDLLISSALLGQISGFDSVTIGRSDSTAAGTITVGDGSASVLSLPANLQLLSGAAAIKLLNAVSSNGGTLGITSTTGNVSIEGDVGGSGANLASLTVDTGGTITVKGVAIHADSALFDGNVTLGGTTTTLAGGTYTFTKDISGTSDGDQILDASGATLTKLQGKVGTASLALKQIITGSVELSSQLFAAELINLGGSITLRNNTTLNAAAVTLGANATTDNVTAGAFDLTLVTDALTTNLHSVTGGGDWTLTPWTANKDILIATSGTTELLVDPALFAQWKSFDHMTIGASNAGDITIDHSAAISLGTDLTLRSGGDVSILSALQGGQVLTINADGQTYVKADLGTSGNALAGVVIMGKAEFAGGGSPVTVRTSGDQDYQGEVTIADATTLITSAGDVHMGDKVLAKTGTSNTETLTIDTTGGRAQFDGDVGVAGSGGTPASQLLYALTTNAAVINTASVITRTTQTYHGAVALGTGSGTPPTDIKLVGSTVTIEGAITGSADGDQALTIDGNAVLKGAIGTATLALKSLEITGASTLSGGNVFTDGDQTYTGALTLGNNTTLTSGSGTVAFGNTIDSDGPTTLRTLTVDAAAVTFSSSAVGGTQALSSLTTHGSTTLAGAVTTTGDQVYNDDVTIDGNITLASGGDVRFLSTVDADTAGADALTVNASGVTRFASTVGAANKLASLSTDGSGTTELAGNIATTGAIDFGDAVTLTGTGPTAITITHGDVLTFNKTVDGARNLILKDAAGNTDVIFKGTVGGTTALTSLTVDGTSATSFGSSVASVTTSGAQQYGGAVTLSGTNQVFSADNLEFASLSGANGLTLSTNGLTLGSGGLSGIGALVIQTRDAGTTIGVGDTATGNLNIAQNVLNGSAGFSSLVIGRADGSGTIQVVDADLGTHTTLRSGSGTISLDGAVNSHTSAVDLRVETGGAIILQGNLGSARALREISASHTVSTPTAISIAASKVTLQSSTTFTLNNLTLTGSGASLLQSSRNLVLAGNINLSGGGTLGLVSTMAPTKIAVSDDEYAGNNSLSVGLLAGLREASAGIEQTGGKIVTSAGTTLYVRTTQGASINLMQADNDIQGGISAVSGRIGENVNTTRLTTADGSGEITVGFVRIASKQINVLGQPLSDADQSLVAAGIEGDAVLLSADKINTSVNNGLIRARLPYDNNQGTLTAVPGLTLELSATGLNANQAYGGVVEADRIQVSVGNSTGGYITVRPKGGASLGPGFVSLSGSTAMRPFYDGSGKVTEVPIFYNGDVPQTPQEVGALSAVTAVIEESRRQRFEEAVRTENVSARLRSGVIAEVGAGRPATEGSDSIRMPTSCTPSADSLSCQ